MSGTEPLPTEALVILAQFVVPEAAWTAFLVECTADAQGSVSEPGCRQFDVLTPEDAPGTVILLEVYDDADAFEAHLRTPHYARFKAATQRLDLEPPSVRRLSRLHRGAV